MKRPRTRIIPGNGNHGNDYEISIIMMMNQNNDEIGNGIVLNISICQWRIEHISENILLKSVPQRVICSCTAWSVGFTCIKNSTLISKQIFSWFSFWLWSHRTARWLQVLCTTGLLLFAGKHLFFKSGKVPKLFTIHKFWITVLGSSSPAASLTVPVILS